MAKTNDSQIPNCLLVDDLEENLIALKAMLENEPVKVFTARSGTEALELLLENDFALSMIDVQMPEMNGFELAEIMRSTEQTRHIPIIFVTAAGSDAQRVFRGYEAGAVDFLHKPLASQIVLGKVRIFLELYNHKSQLIEKIRTLGETEATLQKALQSRDDFLSICSHELKTPLTSLKLQVQIMDRKRKKQGEEVAYDKNGVSKFIKQVDLSTDRILHLVNDMLDISRVTTGKLSLYLEEVNLKELMLEVADRLKPLMEMANCNMKFNLQENIFCRLDRFRIEQVLINLLTNVAKYAPDKPMEMNLEKSGDYAHVSIIDHGEGITEIDQKRIFDRFERASVQAAITGLGLGLYISKEIIGLHHGTIAVTSKLHEGSSFSFKLPLLIKNQQEQAISNG